MRSLTSLQIVISFTWLLLGGSNLVLMALTSPIESPVSMSDSEVVPPALETSFQTREVEDLPPVNTSVFEDDMRFSEEQIQAMNGPSISSGANDARFRWRGQIAIQISKSFSQTDYNIIYSGLQELAGVLSNCLRVVLWHQNASPTADYVFIKNDQPGCWSYVGKQGGRQDLNLQTPGCNYKGTIVHEMIHAVGFHHEQIRPDRDNYVWINWGNIGSGTEHNFRTNTMYTNTYGVPYDYYSIMHYGERDFSRNGQKTIEAKRTGVVVGSRGVVTGYDRRKVRAMYGCSG